MFNIDTELDRPKVSVSEHGSVIETVTVRSAPAQGRAFLVKPDDTWTWSDLRDYVVSQIEAQCGVQPRDQRKEYGIFTRFLRQWGALAPRIARYAFEIERGYWMGSPITVNRFTKGSDPYFAEVIVNRFNLR